MKKGKLIFRSFYVFVLLGIIFSCNKDKINPNLEFDEVLIPQGYNLSDDVLVRLEELRLENPFNHYYYLERENKIAPTSKDWVFQQNELKIEYIDNDKTAKPNENPNILGVIVKKIDGNWEQEVFTIVDDQPVPKGGMKAFYEYITQSMKYPEQARHKGIEGKVYVQFIVNVDGKLIDVKALKGIGAGCDTEAVKVVKESPKWNPGMVGDRPGKVKMILPITFKLG